MNGAQLRGGSGPPAQVAEAYTCQGSCTSKLTDEYFSYSLVGSGSMQGGVLAQMWQSTPNSGGYFLTQDTLYPNGALGARTSVLGSASYGYPSMSYGLDGEGRPYWASDATRCINPVTATTYNASGSATSIAFGNASNGGGADVDTFQYDPNTNRPTSLNYYVDASSSPFNVRTQLNWNANGSLNRMVYTDENDASKNQTCSYAADDLSRITSAQCNSTWAQTFSYDPFGNIKKNQYQANYSSATNQVSSGITPTPQYDLNGNQVNLTAVPAPITWNAWNVPVTISGSSATYDAMGRMVEKVSGGTATQFVYSPSGTNIASVSAGVLVKGTVPLPGGDTAIYSGTSGNPYIRHTDWLGSSRLATTWAHAVQSKVAYAPFGETYNEAGAASNDRSFTGQDQNVVQGSLGTGVYDYLFRKYDPSAGRWLSPDPYGWNAVDPANPQTLNRNSYVGNMPMSYTDPTGLAWICQIQLLEGGGWVYRNCEWFDTTTSATVNGNSDGCSPTNLAACPPTQNGPLNGQIPVNPGNPGAPGNSGGDYNNPVNPQQFFVRKPTGQCATILNNYESSADKVNAKSWVAFWGPTVGSTATGGGGAFARLVGFLNGAAWSAGFSALDDGRQQIQTLYNSANSKWQAAGCGPSMFNKYQ